MQYKQYGSHGPRVSVLGLGAGQIGDASLDEAEVDTLLNAALDLGINLIDTARGYGLSEERIGRHLSHRRSEYVLSTKLGYGIPDLPDWTEAIVTAGVDEALKRLRTDHIDIVHLHSCELQALQAGAVVDALVGAREQGKIGIVAYSGENEALAWAADDGRVGGLECSVNLFDQAVLAQVLPHAQARGLGVIAKRALGNAPWRFAQQPRGNYCETYWQRMQALDYPIGDMDWDELALRFTAFQPEVSCAIVGTRQLAHLRHNVELLRSGPLPEGLIVQLRERFAARARGWRGEV
jgi:aryl-alcohol dehydrogenase-like predicted oxidoreductase